VTPRILVLRGRHSPHEELLLAVSTVSGLAYLIGSPPPMSIAALMPRPIVYIWAIGLLISGAVGLAGCWWRGAYERGIEFEKAGLLIGAGAMLIYGTAAFTFGGWRALLAGGIVLGWTAANIIRVAKLQGHLRELSKL